MALRCFIVDDNANFLSAARSVLESDGCSVVGLASTAAEALRMVEDLQPDVVLVDVDLGGESGFDLVRRFQRETTVDESRVILISTHTTDDLGDLIATAPARAFLCKSDLSGGAIRRILDGTEEHG